MGARGLPLFEFNVAHWDMRELTRLFHTLMNGLVRAHDGDVFFYQESTGHWEAHAGLTPQGCLDVLKKRCYYVAGLFFKTVQRIRRDHSNCFPFYLKNLLLAVGLDKPNFWLRIASNYDH